ncbi:MAG: GumC family protein [Pirellulales bacterium]
MIQHDDKAPMTLDVFHDLLNHKQAMVWTFSCVMLVTIAVTFLSPKKYTSEAKLFVRLGRESMAMDPTATAATDQVVMVQESREYEINSVFELFKSRGVLANVVSGVGPQVVLGKARGPKTQTASVLATLNVFEPYSIDDEALEHLARHLDVVAAKKSNIIDISYEAPSPELARDVVTRLIDQAREAHIRVNRTDGSRDFFVAQTAQLRDKVARLEAELRDRKNAAGIVSLSDQRALMLEQVAELQSGLRKTEAMLSASTAEMQSHQKLLEQIPETITTGETTGMPHSAVSSMREQLFAAQVQEKELLSRVTEHHPRAVASGRQIAALEAVLAQEPVAPQVALGPNRAHQEINLAYFEDGSSVASLRAQAATLREQLSPVQQQLKTFNDNEAEFLRLQREIDIEAENYKRYSENLEQARINHELEMKNMSNLNVLQPPTFSVTPTSPRRLLNLALGLVVALASSLGVGLFLEQRKTGFLYGLAQPSRESVPLEAMGAASGPK